MITALLDTNVLLDVVLDRPPFVQDSGTVWRACDAGQFSGYVSANSITTRWIRRWRRLKSPRSIGRRSKPHVGWLDRILKTMY